MRPPTLLTRPWPSRQRTCPDDPGHTKAGINEAWLSSSIAGNSSNVLLTGTHRSWPHSGHSVHEPHTQNLDTLLPNVIFFHKPCRPSVYDWLAHTLLDLVVDEGLARCMLPQLSSFRIDMLAKHYHRPCVAIRSFAILTSHCSMCRPAGSTMSEVCDIGRPP